MARVWRAVTAVIALALGAGAGAVRDGAAHPHVFVESAAVLTAERDGIRELRIVWSFDPLFSAALLRDHDTDRDGALSPAEIAALKVNAFDNLEHFNYFLVVDIDGEPFQPRQVHDFDARVVRGQLVYLFTVRLPRLAVRSVEVVVVDPEYFVDFRLNASLPFQLRGDGAGRFRCETGKGREVKGLLGAFAPDAVLCRQDRAP